MESISQQSSHKSTPSPILEPSDMGTPVKKREETKETTDNQFVESTVVISKDEQLIQAGVCFLATVISEDILSLDLYLNEYKKVLSEESGIDFSTSITSQIISVVGLLTRLIFRDPKNFIYFKKYRGLYFVISLLKMQDSRYSSHIIVFLASYMKNQYFEIKDHIDFISDDTLLYIINDARCCFSNLPWLTQYLIVISYSIVCLTDITCIQEVNSLLVECTMLPNSYLIVQDIISVYRCLIHYHNDKICYNHIISSFIVSHIDTPSLLLQEFILDSMEDIIVNENNLHDDLLNFLNSDIFQHLINIIKAGESTTTPIAWRLAVYVLYQKPENIRKELLTKFIQLFTMILDSEWGEESNKERIVFLTHFIIEAETAVLKVLASSHCIETVFQNISCFENPSLLTNALIRLINTTESTSENTDHISYIDHIPLMQLCFLSLADPYALKVIQSRYNCCYICNFYYHYTDNSIIPCPICKHNICKDCMSFSEHAALDEQEKDKKDTVSSSLLDPLNLPPVPPYEKTKERDKEVEIMMVVKRKLIFELTLEDIECMERYYLLPESIMREYNCTMFNECSLFFLMKIESLHDLVNQCVIEDKYKTIFDLKYLFYNFVKNEEQFNQNIHRKPAIFQLISSLMDHWKNNHLSNINRIIQNSKKSSNFSTFIYYTDTWGMKKKVQNKRVKSQCTVKKYTFDVTNVTDFNFQNKKKNFMFSLSVAYCLFNLDFFLFSSFIRLLKDHKNSIEHDFDRDISSIISEDELILAINKLDDYVDKTYLAEQEEIENDSSSQPLDLPTSQAKKKKEKAKRKKKESESTCKFSPAFVNAFEAILDSYLENYSILDVSYKLDSIPYS